MNRRFTLITLLLTATVAFFLGVLVAGPLTPAGPGVYGDTWKPDYLVSK